MKKILYFFILLVILTSCKKENVLEDENISKTNNSIIPVKTSYCSKDDLIQYLFTNGRAEARNKVTLVAESTGKIDSIYVENNSYVNKGDLIAKLNNKELLLDLKSEMIKFNKIKAEYDAWLSLENSNSDKLKIQTGLDEAELSIEKLNMLIDKCYIKAPISGYISNFEFTLGDYIRLGSEIAKIINNNNMEIKVKILENDIVNIHPKQDVKIRFLSLPNSLYNGKIISVSPTIEDNDSTCEVVIGNLVNKSDENVSLKSGMFAEIKIEINNYGEKLLIPKSAVIERNNKKLVFTVENNLAKWKYVTIGCENDKFYEILSGCNCDDEVVIEGNFSLSHDAKLIIKEKVPFEYIKEMF